VIRALAGGATRNKNIIGHFLRLSIIMQSRLVRDDVTIASLLVEACKTARAVEDTQTAVGVCGGICRLRRFQVTQLSVPTTRSSWMQSTSSIGRPT
jgi:hypothetical protein